MTDDEEWQQAEETLRAWRSQGRSVEEFVQAVVTQMYRQDFPPLAVAETETWERALGTTDGVTLPALVRLRLQGLTWYQALGCLPGLWLSRPEDTQEIARLTRELKSRDDTIAAGLRENTELRAQRDGFKRQLRQEEHT